MTMSEAKKTGQFDRLVRLANAMIEFNKRDGSKTLMLSIQPNAIEVYHFEEDNIFFAIQFLKRNAAKRNRKRK